ncbi:MAG: hypothetical protein ACK4N5_13660, partial [Myxococcales bacterium]
APAAEATRPLLFEPFREPKERAFTAELPGDWERETDVVIVKGSSPYVRATTIGRSPENQHAFVHYKLASFQVPVPDLTPKHPAFRFYESGAQVLERYLFPAVAQRDPQAFGEWAIERRGALQPLFSHPSGVRFDGQEVEYGYRYRGERMRGRAFVVTYLLPQAPSPVWFLYGLYGWEAPLGREANARAAGLRLLETFSFEDRYAPQADMFWTLARDAALRTLRAEPAPREIAQTPRRLTEAENDAFARAALTLVTARGEDGQVRPVKVGIEPLFALDAPSVPRLDMKALEALR